MTEPTWVDGWDSMAAADVSLHAGIMTDLLRGNLRRAFQESFYDLDSFLHEDDEVEQTIASADTYTWLTDLGAFPIPVRFAERDLRKYLVSFECAVDTGQATILAYVKRDRATRTLDATAGLSDETAYTTFNVASSSLVEHSGTVTLSGVEVQPLVDWAGRRRSVQIAWLMLAASVSSAGAKVKVLGPRVKEVLP